MADAQGKFVAAEPLFDDLPSGWALVRLGDLGLWSGGGTPSKAEPTFWTNGTIPWVSPKDMKVHRILDAEDHITASAVERSATKIIPSDSVLMVTRSGILAHTFPVAVTAREVTVNQDIKALTPNAACDAYYLAWFLRCRSKEILRNCAKNGTTVASVDTDSLKAVKAPLPPLTEQRRIVSRIDELFSRIEAGERAIAASRKGLKRYRKSILKAAVTGTLTSDWREERGKPEETGHELLARTRADRERQATRDLSPAVADGTVYELPSSWAWATLDRLAIVKGGVTVDRNKVPDDPVTMPYLRVANVQEGRIELSEVKEITVERTKANDCLLRRGDILLNEGGDLDKLGRGWVWEGQVTPCIHQNHVFRARPLNADINPYFVSHYANTMGRNFFMEKGKHSVNLASISLTEISKLPVPLPPPDEQAEIVSRVEEALSRIDHAEATLDAQARNARGLKQSILKAAFGGRLVAQDSNDEPAADMLARIADKTPGPAKKTKAHV